MSETEQWVEVQEHRISPAGGGPEPTEKNSPRPPLPSGFLPQPAEWRLLMASQCAAVSARIRAVDQAIAWTMRAFPHLYRPEALQELEARLSREGARVDG